MIMWMDVVMIVVMTMRAMAGAVAGALEFEPHTIAPDHWFDRGGHGRCKWSVLFEKAAPDRCPRPFMIMLVIMIMIMLRIMLVIMVIVMKKMIISPRPMSGGQHVRDQYFLISFITQPALLLNHCTTSLEHGE